MKSALDDIPATLNETYARILERMPEGDQPLAREALCWLCFSLMPMRLSEIAEAVVIEEGDTIIDSDSRLTNPEILIDICKGLISWAPETGLVTLAHDSIRTFLTSDWIKTSPVSSFHLDPPSAHRTIMRKCLTYLQLTSFSDGPTASHTDLIRIKRDHPLLSYATYYWPIHTERFPLLPQDETLILHFFNTSKKPNGANFASWVQFLLGTTDLPTIQRTEPLYYAASYNMVPILKILLRPEHNVDINKPGGRFGSPPLFVALWRGNAEATKLLVDAGADTNAVDAGSGTSVRVMAKHMRREHLLPPTGEKTGERGNKDRPTQAQFKTWLKEKKELESRTL